MSERRNTPPNDSLEGLLRGDTKGDEKQSTAAAAKKKTVASQADLADLLGSPVDRGGGFSASAAVRGVDAQRDTAPSLDGMLRGDTRAAPSPAASPALRPKTPASRASAPELDALLHPEQSPAHSGDTRKRSAAPAGNSLAALLEDADRRAGSPEQDVPDTPGRFALSRRALAGIGAVLVLLAGALVWHSQNNRIKVPDSEVARQLMRVVKGVEKFKAGNRVLPDKLSTLKEFPQGAVEFEMKQYGVQLANPKLEFFYVTKGANYYVVARYYNEAWIYKGEKKPRLISATAR